MNPDFEQDESNQENKSTEKREHETISIYITKVMLQKYGPTENCSGCRFALGCRKSECTHTDACRNIFLEIAEIPGNEDLREQMNKSMEKATKIYSEAFKFIPISMCW